MTDLRECAVGPQFAQLTERLDDVPRGLMNDRQAGGVRGEADPVLRQLQVDNLRVWLLNADLRTGEGRAALGIAVARVLLEGNRTV